jgi:hypothetical protein
MNDRILIFIRDKIFRIFLAQGILHHSIHVDTYILHELSGSSQQSRALNEAFDSKPGDCLKLLNRYGRVVITFKLFGESDYGPKEN